jgi:hypothetical protein
LVGVTRRVINGKNMLWVGVEAEGNSKGWKEEEVQSKKSNES